MPARLDIEYIRNEFASEGYLLLSNRYINSKEPIKFKCPDGHTHITTWNSWQHGNRCPYCSGNKIGDYEIGPLGFIKDSFSKEGFIVLSDEFRGANQKIFYECHAGHRHSIRWGDWRKGFRCPYCSGKIRKNLEQISLAFKKEGYVLLSNSYKNVYTPLYYKCPNGHKHKTSWIAWYQNKRCPTCWAISVSGPGSPHWRGGVSLNGYCDVWLDKHFKKEIKNRDGNVCLNPKCYGTSSRLSIHHINYDKKDCRPANLITLCASCNSKANKDRRWHKAWYSAVLYRRYGYAL